MLYTLNLYSDVCQLFLNKTGKKCNIATVEKWKNRGQLKQWNIDTSGDDKWKVGRNEARDFFFLKSMCCHLI